MVSIIEKKFKIGENYLNFVISKVENSKPEKTLFLIPGGLDVSTASFKPQLENLPKLLPNYQFISYDPPGLGKSRPPNKREFSSEVHIKDAENIVEFLDQQNVDKFSLLGWSYGAAVATIIAITHPTRVEKFIITTALGYVNEKVVEMLKLSSDISIWPESTIKPFVELYGLEEFTKMWAKFVEYFVGAQENLTPEGQMELVRKIKAETLIFHGEKDFFLDFAASKFLNDHIQNSRLIVYKSGHNLHLKNYKEFNQQVAEFLNEKAKL